jgi:hypothetical protein
MGSIPYSGLDPTLFPDPVSVWSQAGKGRKSLLPRKGGKRLLVFHHKGFLSRYTMKDWCSPPE